MKVVQRSVTLLAAFALLLTEYSVRGGIIHLSKDLLTAKDQVSDPSVQPQGANGRDGRSIQDLLTNVVSQSTGIDPALTSNLLSMLGTGLASNVAQPVVQQITTPAAPEPTPMVEESVDPYMLRTRDSCMGGNIVSCLKQQALRYFGDFLDQQQYDINDEVKIMRMPNEVIRRVDEEPYELATPTGPNDSEMNQFLQFLVRKIERFFKTTAIEFHLPDWVQSLANRGINTAWKMLGVQPEQMAFLENRNSILQQNKEVIKPMFVPVIAVIRAAKFAFPLLLPFLGHAAILKKVGIVGSLFVPIALGVFLIYKPLAQSFNMHTNSASSYPAPGFPSNYGPGPYGTKNQLLNVDHNGVPISVYDSVNDDDNDVYDGQYRRRRRVPSSPRKTNRRR